jgi:hypothetical protein
LGHLWNLVEELQHGFLRMEWLSRGRWLVYQLVLSMSPNRGNSLVTCRLAWVETQRYRLVCCPWRGQVVKWLLTDCSVAVLMCWVMRLLDLLRPSKDRGSSWIVTAPAGSDASGLAVRCRGVPCRWHAPHTVEVVLNLT